MSNYFFSLSSFISCIFKFYLFNTIWYLMLILYIYIKRCFILLGGLFFFRPGFQHVFEIFHINQYFFSSLRHQLQGQKQILWEHNLYEEDHLIQHLSQNVHYKAQHCQLASQVGPVLSLHCYNPPFTSFCCLLISHGRKSIKLILITFSLHTCALYCTTVWHIYNNYQQFN